MSVPLPVPAGPPVPLAPVAPAVLPVVTMAPVALPPEAARGVPPQEWALVRQRVQRAQRVEAKRLDLTERRSASTGCLGSAAAKPRPGHLLQHAASSDSVASSQGDSVDAPLSPGTPESPDSHVQIFEFLKTNCRTEEYVDKIVPSIVEEPRRLKDVPDVSRTLTRLPEGFTREKDILEDLGHKSLLAAEEVDESADEAAAAAEAVRPAVRLGQGLAAVPLPANLLRYLDESRCSAPPPPGRRRSSMSMSLSALSQRLPLPSHLRKLTVKNIKLSLGKLCRRRTVVITESDPSYKVAYLGNVLTGWAKGEGCAEKPLSTLWKNYTASNKPDVNMKVAVTRSGLKATTREHGLTEYWSHRITHCAAPPAFPRVFCWVYRHEGRKLKQELRCHAVLCAREDQARRMAQQLTERLALALLEFRRDKQSREQARLSLANALHDNPSLPQRKLLLSTGASNYRPPLERSKSAPKLGSIEEVAEEDEAGDVYVFGHPRAVKRFLRDERLAAMRRQHFRESLRRKLASARNAEEPEEPEDPMRHDPRHEVLTVVRVNSIEEEPDPEPEALPAEVRDAPLRVPPPPPSSSSSSAQQQQQQPPQPSARARAYLLDVEDAAESDEGSSSLQSISSDGTTCGAACGVACGAVCTAHSHSRTDSGEDFCLGADAATSDGLTRKARHRDDREDREEAWDGDRDDFDDNVSDESGYVEAPSEALALALSRRTATGRIAADLKGVKSCKGDRDQDLALAKACAEACTLREGRAQSLQGRQGLQV